jgi:hypothetical protein
VAINLYLGNRLEELVLLHIVLPQLELLNLYAPADGCVTHPKMAFHQHLPAVSATPDALFHSHPGVSQSIQSIIQSIYNQ